MTVKLENCNEIEWETLKTIASFHESICFIDACRVIFKPKTVEVWNEDGTYFRLTNYLTDLNSLVPVWEKLELFYEGKKVTIEVMPDEEFVVFVGNESGWKPTIQQAAALATAKSIQEIGNGK